ncbi:MAG: GH39 family glycosyl hydrolase [Planctomycetota bacterium]|jgi:hypothetical protein
MVDMRTISVIVLVGFLVLFSVPSLWAQCGNESSPYGICVHAPWQPIIEPQFDEVAACGIGWIRIDFLWKWVEPSQDSWDWSHYDTIVEEAEERGLRIFATMQHTPQWATSGGEDIGVPNNAGDFYDVCYQAASRYVDAIEHWGMWNEPNLDHFWEGTRQQYIDIILKNGANAVHAANPDAKVCGPELAHLTSGDQDWYAWLTDCITQAFNELDIVTHHVYDSSGHGDVTNKLEDPAVWPWDPPSVKEVLEDSGWFGNPLWLTETGWQSGDVGEANQANYYTGLLNDWFTGNPSRSWIDKIFFYELHDATGTYSWGILGVEPNYPRKQSFYAYQSFISSYSPDPVLPCKATNPDPQHMATSVSREGLLSWTSGVGATLHKVYFGSPNPVYQGEQGGTTFDPGSLSANTTYKWRIDGVNAVGEMPGDVWQFTTEAGNLPGQASNPAPPTLASGVILNPDLSWLAGEGSTSHRIYFGTPTPVFQVEQSSTVYDPGILLRNTTYTWRIDERNGDGITTGVVWQFTTRDALPGDMDGDNDSDQEDFGMFQLCYSGSGLPYGSGCEEADLDGDGSVDPGDFNVFIGCMSGPNVPVDTNCLD